MTITEMVLWFDVLTDKRGDPYFANDEKEAFINRATIDYINALFPEKGQGEPMEATSIQLEKVAPLLKEISLNTDTVGAITYTAIGTAISGTYWRVFNIWRSTDSITCQTADNYKYAQFVRHNDFPAWQVNKYKQATDAHPLYRLIDYLKLDPEGIRKVKMTVMKYPRLVSISTPTSSDMPDFTHNDIMKLAIAYAGFSARDAQLAGLLK